MKHEFKKDRKSTKDRFVSVMAGKNPYNQNRMPWYRKRGNFLILIMIVFFTFIYFAAKVVVEVNSNQNKQPVLKQMTSPEQPDSGEMDYEEAKRIFGGSQ